MGQWVKSKTLFKNTAAQVVEHNGFETMPTQLYSCYNMEYYY